MSVLGAILWGIPWTLALTASAFLAGGLLGIVLFALRDGPWRPVRWFCAGLIMLVRSIPPLVWLFIVYFGVESGAFRLSAFEASVIGLSIITAANMAEIYRGAVRGVHSGQSEAAAALGLPAHSVVVDVFLPQVLRIALPAMATFAIGLLKDTAVASVLGVQEIAFKAYNLSQQTFRGLDVYAFAALLYVALSLPLAMASRRLDATLQAKAAR